MKTIKTLKTLIAITTFTLFSCSKDNPPTPTPVNTDLTLTKTERIVAAPIRNLSDSWWWVAKFSSYDKFAIHNYDNTATSADKGMMIYDIATNTFTDKSKSSNVVAAGYISQLLAGNGVLYYIANEFNTYTIATDTWSVNNALFPANIKDNHGESKGCVLGKESEVFFIGGRISCKTVKYFNWTNNTWNFAADYPISIEGGPETVTDNQNLLYTLGGFIDSSNNVTSKEFFKYDVLTNTWKKLADALVDPLQDYTKRAMVFFKNKYVIFLGKDHSLHIYDIETNKWQVKAIDTGISVSAQMDVSADGTKIYLLYRKAKGSLGIQEYK